MNLRAIRIDYSVLFAIEKESIRTLFEHNRKQSEQTFFRHLDLHLRSMHIGEI